MTRLLAIFLSVMLWLSAPVGNAEEGVPLSAREIVARAQAAAGGETWIHPQTLLMRGHAVFYTPKGVERHERYDMWRVYPKQKGMAHAADGKVLVQPAPHEHLREAPPRLQRALCPRVAGDVR